jgi:6-phosphogluconolactonase/glucosamine-6-phosphate isomerase/deaminase
MVVTSIDESGSLNVNVRQGLLKAREVVLVVTGANKREVVKKKYSLTSSGKPSAAALSKTTVTIL